MSQRRFFIATIWSILGDGKLVIANQFGANLDIYEILWRDRFVEKLAVKHDVSKDEVESVLSVILSFDFGRRERLTVKTYTWFMAKPMEGVTL